MTYCVKCLVLEHLESAVTRAFGHLSFRNCWGKVGSTKGPLFWLPLLLMEGQEMTNHDSSDFAGIDNLNKNVQESGFESDYFILNTFVNCNHAYSKGFFRKNRAVL